MFMRFVRCASVVVVAAAILSAFLSRSLEKNSKRRLCSSELLQASLNVSPTIKTQHPYRERSQSRSDEDGPWVDCCDVEGLVLVGLQFDSAHPPAARGEAGTAFWIMTIRAAATHAFLQSKKAPLA